MDLPLKVELQKLSHLHVLELLLPIVPGLVVTLGLTLGNSPLAHRFWNIGAGYKAKLAIALAATYIAGLSVIAIVQSANNAVMRLTRKLIRVPAEASPWGNTYWRRVAGEFVGRALSPDTRSFTAEELDGLSKYITQMGNASAKVTNLGDYRAAVLRLETALQAARQNAIQASGPGVKSESVKNSDAGVITQSSTTLEGAKQTVLQIEGQLRDIGIEFEWMTLHEALEHMHFASHPVYPFGAFGLLWESLQAAGISAIWLMVQYRDLRNAVGVLLAGILVVATSYGLWMNFRLNGFRRSLDSSQVAGMIREMCERSTGGHLSSSLKEIE